MNNQDILLKAHSELVEGKLSQKDVEMYNPLALAYMGDTVFDLFVRSYLVSKGSRQVNKLHKEAIAFVKAKAQADALAGIKELLTEEEKEIVKRGRNAKSHSVPKNANLIDYRMATGLETLFGYLYLLGRGDRINELMSRILDTKG